MANIPTLRVSENGEQLTAQRESGPNPLGPGFPDLRSQWVVRDQNGDYKDHDKYQNDLKARFPGLRVLGI